MMHTDKFEELTSCGDPAFEQLYRVYAESIAKRELKSRAWICEMVGSPDYKVFLLQRSSQVIGFSMVFLPQSAAFALLEYMAVEEGHRNSGLGGDLFRRSMQGAVTREGKAVPVLLEVDSDREHCFDWKLRTRRQQFYRRLGCLKIAGLRYILPLPGEGKPPEMDLMIYPAGNQRQVSKVDLERWLKTMYQDVYRCPPDDPRIGRMLAGLPEIVELV